MSKYIVKDMSKTSLPYVGEDNRWEFKQRNAKKHDSYEQAVIQRRQVINDNSFLPEPDIRERLRIVTLVPKKPAPPKQYVIRRRSAWGGYTYLGVPISACFGPWRATKAEALRFTEAEATDALETAKRGDSSSYLELA